MSRLTPSFVHRKYEAVVAGALDRVRQRLRLFDLMAAAIWLATAAAVYVALVVVADQAMPRGLPLGLRRGMLIVAAGVLAIVAAGAALRTRARRLNQDYLAWLIERRFPRLRHSLLTSMQLGGQQQLRPGVVIGVIRRCARVLHRVDAGQGVTLKRPTIALRAACAAAVFLLLYAAIAPKPIGPSLLRALGWDVAAPTRTRLEWVSPERGESVLRGADLAFAVRVRGRAPGELRAEFSTDGGRTTDANLRLPLAPPSDQSAETDLWRGTQPGRLMRTDVHARVAGGDAVSEWRLIDVRSPPDVARLRATYEFPAYCGIPNATRDGGEIDVLAGTRVTLHVTADTVVAGGALQFQDAGGEFARRLDVDPNDATHLTTSWLVESDARYRVILRDRWDSLTDRPSLHRQHARLDVPPEVQFLSPDAEAELSPGGRLAVSGRATDDFGVSETAVALRRGAYQSRIVLRQPSGDPPPRAVEIGEQVAIDALRAAPGDMFEYRLEATDNRCDFGGRPAGRTGVSEWRTARVRAVEQVASAARRRGQSAAGGRPQPADDKDDAAKAAGGSAGKRKGDSTDSKPTDDPAGDDDRQGPATDQQGNADGAAARDQQPMDESNTGEPAEAPETPPGAAEHARPSSGSQPSESDMAGDGESDDARTHGEVPQAPDGSKPDAPQELKRWLEENRDAVERLTRRGGEPASQPAGDDGSGEPGRDEGTPPEPGRPGAEQGGPPADPPPDQSDAGTDSSKSGSAEGERPTEVPPGEGASDESRPDEESSGDQKGEEAGKGDSPGADGDRAHGEKQGDDGGVKNAPQPGADDGDQAGGRPSEADKTSGSGNAGERGEHADDGRSGQDANTGNDAAAKQKEGSSPDGPKGEPRDGDRQAGDSAEAKGGADQKGGTRPGGAEPSQSGDGGPGADSSQGRDATQGPGQPGAEAPASQPTELTEEGRFAPEGDTPDLPAGIDRVEQAVDELERQLRAEDGDPEMLRELGWDRARANRFVREFRRRVAEARGGPDRTQPPRGRRARDGVQPGERELKLAHDDARSAAAGRLDDAGTSGPPGSPLSESPPELVPPEYRDLLDAYYREMARDERSDAASKASR